MRKFIRHRLPHPDSLREHRIFGLLGNTLLHPRLWHLNRRSAAGGIAVGLFCGMIPGPLQMLGAGILCVFFRVNLPLALVGTFFSNPLTIVPLYLAAFMIGRFVTGSHAHFTHPPEVDWNSLAEMMSAWAQWIMQLGEPLLVGLPLLALLLAAAGYFSVKYGWEIWLRHSWHKRCKTRRCSSKAQLGAD
ncbi:DUF2062 domain-containing protein [Uliginosibacterium aquaticum]|uniref:DUF2062 domain-containing protein n=1 Tax=Uliginosibacterium aquaticum TaxID=2731212 RepID=A0ABX2IHW6_9RHOO|nr:DUF2062 domain-containing protein [Uliginosibacterium aquaticum]NSL54597.1 DUF2062 domain-containing protein [Uliginosibacterium aquaticum]